MKSSPSGENGLELKGLGGCGSVGCRPKGRIVGDVSLDWESKNVEFDGNWEKVEGIWEVPLTSGD